MRIQLTALILLSMSLKVWTCQDGDIRLRHSGYTSSNNYYGTVEICLNDTWGTVCDDRWDSTNAGVVCRQLRYSYLGATPHSRALYGNGSGIIHLDDVNCRGSESRLIDCPYDNNTNYCTHSEDAGVYCQSLPAAPQNVRGFATSSTSLRLHWNPPPYQHQSGRIRNYRIRIMTNTMRQFTATQTRIDVSSLHPYSTYWCTVAAITVAQGPQSTPITVQTNQDVPSGPPLSVVAVPSTPYSITLSWSLPRSTQRNGIITGYTVRVTAASRVIFQGSTAATSYTVSSLSPYTRYNCSVAAKTIIGTGPFSHRASVQTKEASPSGAPHHISRSLLNSTTLHLSWQPPLIQHRNGLIREYRVNITEVESGRHFQNTTTTTSITIPFLHPYYNYLCSVAAYTVGIGPYSSTLRVQMPEDAPNAAPHNVRGFATGSTSLFLNWTLPPFQQQNGRIRNYHVNVLNVITNELTQFTTNNTQLTVSSLHPYSTYWCTVAAFTLAQSPPSTPVMIQTYQDVPAVAPTINSTARLHAPTISVTWQPLSQRESRGVVSFYHITYRGVHSNCSESGPTLSTVYIATHMEGPYVRLLVHHLVPRLSYCFQVAAATAAGVGPSSEPILVGLYSNDLFQVHFSELSHCEQWLANRSSSKLEEIAQVVSLAVRQQCYCPLTSEYIARDRLMCIEDNSMLFQGRLISVDSTTSSELLEYLQAWVQSAPMIRIEGKYLHVSSHCSVRLNQLGSTEVNCTDPEVESSQPTATIAAVTCIIAVITLLMTVFSIIAFVCYWRKCASTKIKSLLCKPEAMQLTYRGQKKVAGSSQKKSDMEVEDDKDEAVPAIPPRLYLDDDKFTSEQEDNDNKCSREDAVPAVPPRRYLEDEEFASEQRDSASNVTCSGEDEAMPTVPPRRYLEDEEFASELQDDAETGNITMATSNDKDEHHPPAHFMPQTSESAHIYQPLLPKRVYTEPVPEYQPLTFKGAEGDKVVAEGAGSEPANIYEPLTFEGAARNEEAAEGGSKTTNIYDPLTFEGATRNEERATEGNSSETCHYQPLIFNRNEKHEAGEGKQLTTKANSEASHYQPLVFPKEKQSKKKRATHIMMKIY